MQKDRERAVYGLKEKNLAKIYIKIIPLGIRDPDAIHLQHWKKPIEHEVIPLVSSFPAQTDISPP
jgi:DNA ligase-4